MGPASFPYASSPSRVETVCLMACQDELVSILPQGSQDSGDTGNNSLQSWHE